ncbi:MAG: hypothetical protein ACAH83_04820 [Alphaproteobacteria bacterium]
MPFGKKLKTLFNRAARSGAYTTGVLVTSVTIGLGVGLIPDHVSDKPPVKNTATHDAAMKKAGKLGDDIVRGYNRLVFDSEALRSARANLGQGNSRLKEQWNDLEEMREKYKETYNAQYRRMDDFERQMLFSPDISEAETQKMLEKLRGSTVWNSEPYRRFEELEQKIAYRDEARNNLKLPASPETTTYDQLLKMRVAINDAGFVENAKDTMNGFGAAAASAVGLLSLGAIGRRRRDEEQETDAQKPAPVANDTPPPPEPKPEEPRNPRGFRL